MKFKEVAKAYKKTEMFGAVEARDPETVVILVMEELIKSVKSFHKNISIKSGDIINRSKNFSRSSTPSWEIPSIL